MLKFSTDFDNISPANLKCLFSSKPLSLSLLSFSFCANAPFSLFTIKNPHPLFSFLCLFCLFFFFFFSKIGWPHGVDVADHAPQKKENVLIETKPDFLSVPPNEISREILEETKDHDLVYLLIARSKV